MIFESSQPTSLAPPQIHSFVICIMMPSLRTQAQSVSSYSSPNSSSLIIDQWISKVPRLLFQQILQKVTVVIMFRKKAHVNTSVTSPDGLPCFKSVAALTLCFSKNIKLFFSHSSPQHKKWHKSLNADFRNVLNGSKFKPGPEHPITDLQQTEMEAHH